MSFFSRILRLNDLTSLVLDALQSPFTWVARWYVSWQFLKSGYLKVTSWDSTLYLFENEYHTPLLSPHAAAIAAAFGELFFPLLLVFGLASRIGALGLFAVNLVAVISYAHVLLVEGSEAALAQHVLWGATAAFLIIFGPGKWSIDHYLQSRRSP